MKKVILSIFVSILFSLTCAAQSDTINADSHIIKDSLSVSAGNESPLSLKDRVMEAYNNGQYNRVIELLEEEKEKHSVNGEESADLYYNLGNAYFRDNEIAKALLYYEKALLLKPGDKDIRHNIEYANTKIEDKIAVSDTFFLSSWLLGIQNLMASNSWAWFAVICFILLIACLFMFFFTKTRLSKQVAFYTGIVLIILIIFGNVFSYRQKSHVENRDSAIIMSASVPVRSSPDPNSKEVFLLHSGTKVLVTKQDRDWCEIEIADGNVGWIEKNKLEII